MRQQDAHAALMRLGVLLQLQRRARTATAAELPFAMVNESRVLVPYRQAVFWSRNKNGKWKVGAVSGLTVPNADAPFVQWLQDVVGSCAQLPRYDAIQSLVAADLSEDLAASWQEWLPAAGIWLPLRAGAELVGVLALFRDDPFRKDEVELLGHLAETYGQSLAVHQRNTAAKSFLSFSGMRKRLWLLPALCALLLFPVRQTVLAPAEVIPLRPTHIRVPLEGVVESILVRPNQAVAEGDPLLKLEDGQLRTRLTIMKKSLESAKAELVQTQQLSLGDARAKIRLPMLQGRVEQITAEAVWVESQLARILVVSPASGLAVFEDPNLWLGRPVSLGQKIMEVAAPYQVQLEIALPMTMTLPIAEGEELLFFPNISPHDPVPARLTFISYQASETPEAGIAFTLRAVFDAPEGAMPRLGLRGMAKLYGDRRPLGLLLLHIPLLQARQWLGI